MHESLESAVRSLHRRGKLGGPDKKAAQIIDPHLEPDERVDAAASGRLSKNFGLIVITDRRVIAASDAFVKRDLTQIPLSEVTAVEWMAAPSRLLQTGEVRVRSASAEIHMETVPIDQGEAFVRIANLASSPIGQPAAPEGDLDTLQKLGELHAAGVLTDHEFETKKSEILGRI